MALTKNMLGIFEIMSFQFLNPAHALHGGVSYFAFVRLYVCLCVCVCGQDISKSMEPSLWPNEETILQN